MGRLEQCIEALRILGEATAAEVAQYMVDNNYAARFERNLAHPRLTELVESGTVEECGFRYDSDTDRDVTVYRLT